MMAAHVALAALANTYKAKAKAKADASNARVNALMWSASASWP